MYYTYTTIAFLTFNRMHDVHVTRTVAVQECYGLVCMIQTSLEQEIHCRKTREQTKNKNKQKTTTPFIVK